MYDSGNNIVAFERMDGAILGSIAIAEKKARAAVLFRRETKLAERGPASYVVPRNTFQSA
jgi:uncharacterized protein GlcG (DUF336 family)